MTTDRLIAIRLSKEGFGSPSSILETATDIVLDMLNYSNFMSDYQETANEINKEGAS